MSRVLYSVWFIIQGIIQNTTCSVWFRIQCIIKKMSRVLVSVWFSIQRIIQGIIQNMTSILFSVWFRIQGIINKCPGYYSASGSVFSILFRVLFKIRLAYYSASGSGFRVLLKNVQGIIQRLVQYSAYYSKMARVLFSIWFSIQHVNMFKVSAYAVKTDVYATCSVLFGKCHKFLNYLCI